MAVYNMRHRAVKPKLVEYFAAVLFLLVKAVVRIFRLVVRLLVNYERAFKRLHVPA